MKKIIGVLGVAVIAVAMFFSANAVSGNSTNTDLASLMTLNKAHADAEGIPTMLCRHVQTHMGPFVVRECEKCVFVYSYINFTEGTCTESY